MNILRGNLVLGGLETGHEEVSWVFNVKQVNGVDVEPKPDNQEKYIRKKGTKRVDKVEDPLMKIMSPEEYAEWFKEWEKTKSPRVVGGDTSLRTGDYLEVFEDDTYTNKIWIGTVCLVACEIDYSNPLMPDYYVERAQLDVPDFAYWHNMHFYEQPAQLITDFGLQQN